MGPALLILPFSRLSQVPRADWPSSFLSNFVSAEHKSEVTFKIFFLFFFGLFRATPAAYGGSQARGLIGAAAASLHHSYSCQPTPQLQQRQIQTESSTYTTAHGNTGSLTHSTNFRPHDCSSDSFLQSHIGNALRFFFGVFFVCLFTFFFSTVQHDDPVTHTYIYIVFSHIIISCSIISD